MLSTYSIKASTRSPVLRATSRSVLRYKHGALLPTIHSLTLHGTLKAVARSTLFDRKMELAQLESLARTPPACIYLLLGPRNCGKTKLLKSFTAGNKHAIYIDLQKIDTSTPEDLIQAMVEKLVEVSAPEDVLAAFARYGALAPATLKLTEEWGDLGLMHKCLSRKEVASSLASHTTAVFDAFGMLLDAWSKTLPEGQRWPVIVIDEANEIMHWSESYPPQLENLLMYFVSITKQDQRCHVLLTSYDGGYLAWADKYAGPGFCHAEVIGEFTKAQALQFLNLQLEVFDTKIILTEGDIWDKVYQVCGGNALALIDLAKYISKQKYKGEWEQALDLLCGDELQRIKKFALGGQGFTPAQFAEAAIQLLSSPHHVVAISDMRVKLGRHVVGPAATEVAAAAAGEAVLQRMVEANALSMRPYSDWAEDLPLEAFKEMLVVTATSTMALYCMGSLRQTLDKTLEQWRQQQQGNLLDIILIWLLRWRGLAGVSG